MSAKSKKSDGDHAAISGLYLLFARLLNEEPDLELIEILRQPEVSEVFSKADPDFAKYLDRDWTADDFEAAAVDYCDAFILPKVSNQPLAGAWLKEGHEINPTGIQTVAQAFVDQYHIRLPETYSRLPLDHAAVLFYIAAVLRELDSPQVAEFENACLGSWIHRFARAIQSGNSPLYRALGRLLRAA